MITPLMTGIQYFSIILTGNILTLKVHNQTPTYRGPMRIIHRTARPDLTATLYASASLKVLHESFIFVCLINFDVTHAGSVPGTPRR